MLVDWIYSNPMWLVGGIIVAVCIVIACLGLYAFHLVVSLELRRDHNDVAGFTIAIIGVVYAVLLAFIAVATWESFSKADEVVSKEANYLGNFFYDSTGLPTEISNGLRDSLKNYVRVVIEEEWPAQQDGRIGKSSYQKGWDILGKLNLDIARYRPHDVGEAVLYGELLRTLNELDSARRDRILAAGGHIPPVVWWIIVIGGGVTVGYTFLFGMQNFGMHLVMTGAVSGSLALVIALIVALDYPFRGEVSVSSDAYAAVRHIMATYNIAQRP